MGVCAHFTGTSVWGESDSRRSLSRLNIRDRGGKSGGDGAGKEEEDAAHSGHCVLGTSGRRRKV